MQILIRNVTHQSFLSFYLFIFFYKLLLSYLILCVICLHAHLCTECMPRTCRGQQSVRTGVVHNDESPCRWMELNLELKDRSGEGGDTWQTATTYIFMCSPAMPATGLLFEPPCHLRAESQAQCCVLDSQFTVKPSLPVYQCWFHSQWPQPRCQVCSGQG